MITNEANPAQWVNPYRPGYTWIRWDTAESDAAFEQVKDETQRFFLAGVSREDIHRQMDYAGYERETVSRAIVHTGGST